MTLVSPRSSDRLLVALALLFGAPTLLYPFGGDQGLYHYVGREWLHGAVPYRDAMEQKTPLVFALHALLAALTGSNMWAIRAAELLLVVPLGFALAELQTPTGETRRPGVAGVACFGVSLLYFGLFGYWDTAQCEIWYASLSMWSLLVVLRHATSARNVFAAGLLGGLAWLMKPPAAFLILVVLLALGVRARAALAPAGGWRGVVRAQAVYALGVLVPSAAAALYFLAMGALDDLFDQAFLANYHDMLNSSTVAGPLDVLRRYGAFLGDTGGLLAPAALCLALASLLVALRRRDPARLESALVALGLIVAGCLAVTMQRKFYGYHWGVMAPLLALPFVRLAHDVVGPDGPGRSWRAVAPVLLSLALALSWTTAEHAPEYARTLASSAGYVAGRLDRATFLARFVKDGGTPYAHQEAVGRWIADHSAPHDTVAVRGFEQPIYVIARRRAPTRFFWTRWLTEPRRVFRRDEWLAEDRAALVHNPPRYAVVSARARSGPASRAYFRALGYVERFRHGRLIVMEREGS